MQVLNSFRDWVPPILAICAVIAATAFAVSRKSRASDDIERMHRITDALVETAEDVEKGTRSPDEIREIDSLEEDLLGRMSDSRKAGLVASQLSEAARSAGLLVLEIKPGPARRAQPTEGRVAYPKYHVSVRGDYQQIAGYMHGCKSLRIPVRVTDFTMTRFTSEDGAGDAERDLKAELIVEAYEAGEDLEGMST